MKAQELMTKNPQAARPDHSLRDAAAMMKKNDCGCLPVEDPSSHEVVGVVTDRDIVVRAIAEGKGIDVQVREVMSRNPACAKQEDDIEVIENIMAEKKVRRVPVVDHRGHAIGMVAQADIVRATDGGQQLTEHEVSHVIREVSQDTKKERGKGVRH